MPAHSTSNTIDATCRATIAIPPISWLGADSVCTERRGIWSPERDSGSDRLHRLDVHLARALVVARVDELDRTLHDFEYRRVARRADLQRPELRQTVDHPRRVDRRHRHDL